jgi:choline kinase
LNAIILAAGKGERLQPLTNDKPKCLVELFGKSLLEWQIEAFQSSGITDITIVSGYKSDLINFPEITILKNEKYESTNMVETLFSAKEKMLDSTIVSYGDIIFEKNVLESLINSPNDISVIVDKQWKRLWGKRFQDPLSDAESLIIEDGCIVEIGQKVNSYEKICGQYIGLMKFQGSGIDLIKRHYEEAKNQANTGTNPLNASLPFEKSYLTDFLYSLIRGGATIKAVPVNNGWLEIDTLSDLDLYEFLYKKGELVDFLDMRGYE